MANQKTVGNFLVVIGIFCIFFIITMMSLPLIMKLFDISRETRNGMLILSISQALILFIAPSLVAARIVSRNPFSYLSLTRNPGWLPFLGVIFAYLLALPALNQIIYWNANLILPEGMGEWGNAMRELEESANQASTVMLDVTSFGGMVINLLVIGLLTALGEELFFRGALQKSAVSLGAPYAAIWFVALFFSMMHFQFFGFVPRLLLGAWFGYLLFWTRSLYVPIFAHFINNGVVVFCYWLNQNGINYDFENLGVVADGFPLPALVSFVATFIFLTYFRKFFFQNKS